MPKNYEKSEAQRRHLAVQMFRAGRAPDEIANDLQRSRRWVYWWVAYHHQHPHTRFRSASRAAHCHPNQTPRATERRILRLRQTLQHQRNPRLRYAPIGARTIRRELGKRRVKPCPSLSTVQRILRRHGLTQAATSDEPRGYRPHPLAEHPNAVQATDIITRWIEGGEVVQTLNTVDHFTNTAFSTWHTHKRTADARQHLLETWPKLGLPALAQFDNESAFNGGRQPHRLSPVVRLCLYVGAEVLFIPEGEADYNWQVETFNHLWAQQFWGKHHFTQRGRIRPALERFLTWYDTDCVAPRQADTPARMRRGYSLYLLPPGWARRVPQDLPICAGLVHAVRRVSREGGVTFLNETFRVGKRYTGKYVWLTLDTTQQDLTVYQQAEAEADWQLLKVFPYPLAEPVQPVMKHFARPHP